MNETEEAKVVAKKPLSRKGFFFWVLLLLLCFLAAVFLNFYDAIFETAHFDSTTLTK